MELKEFIRESITECVEAIVEAQRDKRIAELGAVIAPSWSQKAGRDYKSFEKSDQRDIEFEVAVTVSNKNGGGFGLNVVNLVNGNINKENAHLSVSRVKLSVPILFPSYDAES